MMDCPAKFTKSTKGRETNIGTDNVKDRLRSKILVDRRINSNYL